MADLKDKIALISGGARGIGGAIADAMCAAGAEVVISDLLDKEGEDKALELTNKGYQATFINHDVTKEADWSNAILHCSNTYGGLDILVNNCLLYTSDAADE